MKNQTGVQRLLQIMAQLRAPNGCPWDREQDHLSLRWHAVEEVYEMVDAIEAGDDHELKEELGDLLLQVVFHCQLASERGAFDFDQVATAIGDKLVRRHPHVFGNTKVKDVDQVWANWEKIKRAEKHGTKHERPSALDGIPKHLPALMRAEKLLKKARKADLTLPPIALSGFSRESMGKKLFELAAYAQEKGWSAEDALRREVLKRERALRRSEAAKASAATRTEIRENNQRDTRRKRAGRRNVPTPASDGAVRTPRPTHWPR